MGLFDAYVPDGANRRFLDILDKAASAALVAAEAYAKKVEGAITDEVAREVANAIKRVGGAQDV